MKTSFRFAAAALAALAALACSEVETADPDNTPSPGTSGKTSFTLTAAIDAPATASRVAMEDDGATAIDLNWKAGDKIYVINGSGTSETVYTFTVANISADGKTASFTCPDYPADATPAYAIHQGTRSYSAFNPASIDPNTSYALSAAALASNFTLYAKYDPAGKRLLFKPFTAILKLNVTLPEAVSGMLSNIRIGSGENSKIFFNSNSYNITGEQPELTSSMMSASKQFTGSASISGGSATVYLQMHPGTELAGHPLDITLVAGSYAYTASVTGGALEAGKCYPLTLPAARWTVGGKIYEGGAGTQDDPYLLKTATNLQALSHATRAGWNTYISRYYRLENDIADIATSSSDPWLPISFNGHFDGNGKTIRGTFHLSDKDGTHLGLFGSASSSSDISDLTLDGEVIYRGTATLDTPLNIGAIAGRSDALTNCKHIGSLTAENTTTFRGLYVGGIAGYCGKNITGCTQQGGTISVNAPQSTVYAGGICAYFSSSSAQMHTCRSESNITVTEYSSSFGFRGALVGNNSGTVYSCSTFLESITITVNGKQQSPLKAIGYGNALDTSEHTD